MPNVDLKKLKNVVLAQAETATILYGVIVPPERSGGIDVRGLSHDPQLVCGSIGEPMETIPRCPHEASGFKCGNRSIRKFYLAN